MFPSKRSLPILSCCVGLLALLGATSLTQAATITYGPFEIAEQPTDWNETLSITQFDPSLGILGGVSFELTATVAGSAEAESLDAAPAEVTTDLVARVSLTDPTGNALVSSIPISNQVDNLAAFDGTIDFTGPSGVAHISLSVSLTESGTSNDFGLFTGVGTIDLPIKAIGESTGSGAGNLITQFSTSASASVSVTYDYIEAVPEPTSALLTLLGMSFLGLRRTRQ